MHDEILMLYYANNAEKLRGMTDRILHKFGGWSNKDVDDFYSLANEVFADVLKKYDDSQPFENFLYVCLLNKIKSEMSRRNREKRKADRMSVSLDASVNNEDGSSALMDLIASGYDLEYEIFGEMDAMTYKLERYLAMLSKRQKKVLAMLSYCYQAREIQKKLHLTQMEYADELASIRSYEKIKILL